MIKTPHKEIIRSGKKGLLLKLVAIKLLDILKINEKIKIEFH